MYIANELTSQVCFWMAVTGELLKELTTSGIYKSTTTHIRSAWNLVKVATDSSQHEKQQLRAVTRKSFAIFRRRDARRHSFNYYIRTEEETQGEVKSNGALPSIRPVLGKGGCTLGHLVRALTTLYSACSTSCRCCNTHSSHRQWFHIRLHF